MVKLQKQPNNSTCGQTCVAMVGGITVEESIKMFGHDKTTNFATQQKILGQLGFDTGERTKIDNRKKWSLPDLAIVRIVQRSKKIGHALVHYKGKFFDPMGMEFNSREEVKEYYGKYGKIRFDHYFEIKGGN